MEKCLEYMEEVSSAWSSAASLERFRCLSNTGCSEAIGAALVFWDLL